MPKSILYMMFAILATSVAIALLLVYRYATQPLPKSKADRYASALEQNDDTSTPTYDMPSVSQEEGWSAKLIGTHQRSYTYPVRKFRIELN